MSDAAAVPIMVLAGTAGVGKTALAVRWARRAAAAFPDGQLYVNLRGYDPGAPVAPADALAGFLRALGLAGEDIPAGEDERAAAYRSLLDGRRVLVVLDNAASVEQARPLLPGSPSCLVVVTSRDSLAGLVARHGARRLALDMLPAADAIGLLRTLIGDRVDAEPDAAAELAAQCARLPLALRVAAELAAASPDSRLAELAGELAGEQRRLDLLDAGGDERTAVRGVFSWSYRHLPAAAARAFRLIGLHPGPDLDAYAVAALTGAPPTPHRRPPTARASPPPRPRTRSPCSPARTSSTRSGPAGTACTTCCAPTPASSPPKTARASPRSTICRRGWTPRCSRSRVRRSWTRCARSPAARRGPRSSFPRASPRPAPTGSPSSGSLRASRRTGTWRSRGRTASGSSTSSTAYP